MSWYRDSDGKIITDEEFQSDCFECSVFCSEGTITTPCDGERTDCPYFKEVDTSDYDKEIRSKVIEELKDKICSHFADWKYSEDDKWIKDIIELASESVEEIAEEMKEVGE